MDPNQEELASVKTDKSSIAAGWHPCDTNDLNLSVPRGIALRKFQLPGVWSVNYVNPECGPAESIWRKLLHAFDGYCADRRYFKSHTDSLCKPT